MKNKIYKIELREGTLFTSDKIFAKFMNDNLSWWDKFLIWLGVKEIK